MSWTSVIIFALLNIAFSAFGVYALILTFGAWGFVGLMLCGIALGGFGVLLTTR